MFSRAALRFPWLATLIVALLVCAPFLAACENASVAAPPPTTITVVGATGMRRALRDLTDEFNRQHSSVLFTLRGGGSTLGEDAVRVGAADLAASTLFPPDPASGVATPTGDEKLVRTPIGLDGLAVIVHPSNSVKGLSLVQLRDLFSGRVIDWQALGSDVGEVLLVSREDGSGSRVLFEKRVMGDDRVSLTAVVMPTSEDVVDYVAKNPQAIGYVSRSEVVEWLPRGETDVAAPAADVTPTPTATPGGPVVKVVSVESLLPTTDNLRSQKYALTLPLYLISNGPPSGRVRQFIDFVLSPAGQSIVARYHAPVR